MTYKAGVMVYYVKARFKKRVLRAGRRMQCLLRPGWMLANYSIQLDWHDVSKQLYNSIKC